MENCISCRYADWYRTKNGELHPSGNGLCTCPCEIPVLPNAKCWVVPPTISGGYINRNHEFDTPCPCYKTESDE